LVDKIQQTPPGKITKKLPLHIFKGCGSPLKNGISVAYLKERTQSPASSAAYRFLMEGLTAGVQTI
jgi:hypothetical protein